MKIVIHMGDCYTNEGPNAKRMRTFYEAFKEKGHEVYVIAPTTEKHAPFHSDVIFCRTTSLKKKTNLTRLMNQCVFGLNSVLHSWKLRQADVVITTTPPALLSIFGWLLAKCLKAKLVYDVRDIWPDVAWEMGSFQPNSIYSRIFQFIRDFMLRHSDLVTTVSPGKVEKLKAYSSNNEVILIPNGFDENFLKNKEDSNVVKKYHLKERKTCVYIGNLGLAQGLSQMLYIAEQAQKYDYKTQFLLFGRGVEEENLRSYIRKHHLENIYMAGYIKNEKIFTILKNVDMTFVPLVNEKLRDSIPTKLFEALGMGCPVLLAACGDAADILQETGLGIAVSPNDKEGLWNAFQRLQSDENDMDKQKKLAKRLMLSKYSRQNAAKKMEQLLSQKFSC